jgi:hypothetical protein
LMIRFCLRRRAQIMRKQETSRSQASPSTTGAVIQLNDTLKGAGVARGADAAYEKVIIESTFTPSPSRKDDVFRKRAMSRSIADKEDVVPEAVRLAAARAAIVIFVNNSGLTVRLATVYAQATANAGSDARIDPLDGERTDWMRWRIISAAPSPARNNSSIPGTAGDTDACNPGVWDAAVDTDNGEDGKAQRRTTSKLENGEKCPLVHWFKHTPSASPFMRSDAGTANAVRFASFPPTMDITRHRLQGRPTTKAVSHRSCLPVELRYKLVGAAPFSPNANTTVPGSARGLLLTDSDGLDLARVDEREAPACIANSDVDALIEEEATTTPETDAQVVAEVEAATTTPEAEAEAVTEEEATTTPEAEAEAVTEEEATTIEPEPEAETVAEATAEPEAETVAEATAEPKAVAEAEAMADAEAVAEDEAATVEPEAVAEAEAEAGAEDEATPVEPEAVAAAEARADPDAVTEAEAEAVLTRTFADGPML